MRCGHCGSGEGRRYQGRRTGRWFWRCRECDYVTRATAPPKQQAALPELIEQRDEPTDSFETFASLQEKRREYIKLRREKAKLEQLAGVEATVAEIDATPEAPGPCNKFLIGADPEFIVLDQGKLVNVAGALPHTGKLGWDHGGDVVEVRPDPNQLAIEVVRDLHRQLKRMPGAFANFKWRAGAFPEVARPNGGAGVALGGHVHLELPYSDAGRYLKALDLLTQNLEKLDLLPVAETTKRRNGGNYGLYSSHRSAGGGKRFEYRTMPSWLYSKAVTLLALTGAKLVAVAPRSALKLLADPESASFVRLQRYFESFKSDPDAVLVLDTILDRKQLKVDPDTDLRHEWETLPEAWQ